jgi:peptidyl-prolyl cis-trans isomerase SurA
MNKVKSFISYTLASLFSLTLLSSAGAATKPVPLDKIAAVINDSVITQSEVNQAMDAAKKQMAAGNMPTPPKDALHKQVLDQLINKKLQLQIAENMGVKLSDTDVDNAINTIAKNNNMTTDELYEKVKEQGLNKNDYRKEIHDQITMQQVQQQAVASKINISQQEVNDFIRSKSWQAFNSKEYHLEDILITLPQDPSPQDLAAAKKRADELLIKLHAGTSFSEAAAAESGNANALQGGDLGWRKLPEIPPMFANDLIHMKSGELLGPTQTPNGYHIVKLVEVRHVANKLNPTQQNQQVRELIFQRKIEEGMQSWLSKVRSEAFINTNPDKLS